MMRWWIPLAVIVLLPLMASTHATAGPTSHSSSPLVLEIVKPTGQRHRGVHDAYDRGEV